MGPVPVLSGVSLGTVIGQLFFSLYINDITEDIDSELYREIKDSEDRVKIQGEIYRLDCWARSFSQSYAA